ncbi:MAG: alpha-glucan phosphorylase [Planctomycetota bacterium]|nr:MAG: alpha-glucan phosphorylase [Planctomycetota bacterium]
MRASYTFNVTPSLPPRLERLRELALNLRWSWDHETIALFRRLDGGLWEETGHNPVLLLGKIRQEKLEAASRDEAFLAHMDRVCRSLDEYMAEGGWYAGAHDDVEGLKVAYFSAEFGLTECLPIYSGGLGILAGDHLKSASDLGVPLVGVGLLYQEGYFRQYLNADGWQQERYEDNDFFNMPVTLEKHADGKAVKIEVRYPGRAVTARIWRIQVGRVPLFLLDTNVPENSPDDRAIAGRLYGGDIEMRLKQEILLGIGGVHALAALGIEANTYHMNEGHSAFMALERIRRVMEEKGAPFADARELTSAGNVFTTHTPVPAGNDRFPPDLFLKYVSHYADALGLSEKELLALGRERPEDDNEPFCMTVLALKLAAKRNGVSKLHGRVSRRMWRSVWPDLPEDEIPIDSITNGVHFRSWISKDLADLYDRYLGPKWMEDPTDRWIWDSVENIPREELWRTHERRRERLVAFARGRLKEQVVQRGGSRAEIRAADEALDPEALTIGFARRFATYKRADLILRDTERLAKILCDRERPVQLIFAGKAHPRDNHGKELLRKIVHLIRGKELRKRVVFLEDYDVSVARYLVQGVDVWLNTPRRLLEASGTSGMKASANGAINVSILDGWWWEAYSPEAGWRVGNDEDYDDRDYQDTVESNALYDMLEQEIVPMFYKRDSNGLPTKWISLMKSATRLLCPAYNTNRMVHDYTEKFYLPCYFNWKDLGEEEMARAKLLAQWKKLLRSAWREVTVKDVTVENGTELRVGGRLEVLARVALGSIPPSDVAVEVYHGQLNALGEIVEGRPTRMEWREQDGDGGHVFRGYVPCIASGRNGFAVRVVPTHQDFGRCYEPGLIAWK